LGVVGGCLQVEALLQEKQQLVQQQEAVHAELDDLIATQAVLKGQLGTQAIGDGAAHSRPDACFCRSRTCSRAVWL